MDFERVDMRQMSEEEMIDAVGVPAKVVKTLDKDKFED